MKYLPIVFVSLVAIEHIYIMVLEMFLWTKPKGLKVFGNTQEMAEQTKVLAANLGLYNGFLAVGLLWGLLHSNPVFGNQIQVFFICCVIVAAIYGGLTANRSILIVQGVPALIALSSLLFL